MRRTGTRTLVILSALGLLMGLVQVTSASSARAQGIEGIVLIPSPLCDTSGWCMNDWYGGTPVRYFEPQASSNEDLEVVYTNRCGGFVTSSCPFTSSVADSEFINDPVVEIYDTASALCVSASDSATAVMGSCPNDSGTGGSPGNIFVLAWDSGSGANTLVSNKYTNAASGLAKCIGAPSEYDGASIYLNETFGDSDCSEWSG